jgi:hypothetical protein
LSWPSQLLPVLHARAIRACHKGGVAAPPRTFARDLLLLLVAALAMGAVSVRLATTAVAELNDPRPPLADAAPVLLPPSPRLARRVVLLLIDGLRADEARALPTLSALAAGGAAGVASSGFPTISQPNYTAVLTGVLPRESGVRTNDYVDPVPLDDLFARVRAAGGHAAYLTQLSTVVAAMFPSVPRMEVAAAPGAIDAAIGDELARGDDFLFVLHNAPDEAAHRFGAAAPAYHAAALEADRALAALLARVDLARDAVVVVADHGHTASGGHGGLEPEVTDVPLVLAGAGVRAGAQAHGATTADVAPTVAALLGVPAPGHALGRVLVETLRGDALATAADAARRAALRSYLAARAPPGWTHPGRALAGLALLALALALLGRAVGRGGLDRRTALAGVTLAALPALLTFLAVGHATPSFIAMPDTLPARMGACAAVVLPLIAAAAAWLLRRRAVGGTCAAVAVALVGAALMAAAAGLAPDGASAGPAALVLVPLAGGAAAGSALACVLVLAAAALGRASVDRRRVSSPALSRSA